MFSGGKGGHCPPHFGTIIFNRPEKGAGGLSPPKVLVLQWKLIAKRRKTLKNAEKRRTPKNAEKCKTPQNAANEDR
jgi:hypothetical protein